MRPDLLFYRFARSLLVGACRLWLRMSFEGLENIPDSGPFILAPVHRSNIDTVIAAGVTRRRMRFMGKDSLWKYRFPGAVFSALGGFPVHRGSADREALRRCIEVIEGGEPLVVFPEGTRRSGPLVQPLFEGASYIAARTGVPIVPVGIGGSEAAMPRGSKMIHPVKVHVIVGKAMDAPTGDRGRASRRAVHDTTEALHSELQRLFDLAQARVGA
ncbi:MAG TPA: lysophospholipid acyltransferase family protein [Acidimicrobiales bacterium]|nr:lysophospholipid acyltransferase family protein [Acidimicrobiales bacterium]